MPSPHSRPFHKRLRDFLFFLFIQALTAFIRLLPRRLTLSIMRGLGRILFQCVGRERRKTIRHLEMAYDKEKSVQEIKAIACRVFQHFAAAIGDFICMKKIIGNDFQGLVTAEGMEHMEKACANGKGAIMITGHYGNWELLGAWLVARGFPLKVVGRALDNQRLNELIVSCRNSAGYENIARGRETRAIIRALNSGSSVGMLIDQDADVSGIFVSFFNRPTYTPIGPAVLARKLHIPIVPVFMHMQPDNTYKVDCLPPITVANSGDRDADIADATQQCSDVYETMIRKHPEQWAWMHKRWKRQPSTL